MSEQNTLTHSLAASVVATSARAKQALALFSSQGLPTKKSEGWRATNPLAVLPQMLNSPAFKSIAVPTNLPTTSGRIVITNGHFDREQSQLPSGVDVHTDDNSNLPLSKLTALSLLCEAHAKNVITLSIAAKTQLKSPLAIIIQNDSATASSRVHVNVGEFSELSLLEWHRGEQDTLSLSNITLNAAQNAKVIWVRTFTGNRPTLFATLEARVAKDANVSTFTQNKGPAFSRHDISLHLDGENASTAGHALFLTKENEHTDIATFLAHHAPHTNSEQLVKGILDDASTGAFSGTIVIDKYAQKSDSKQLSKNLLLSKKARIDTRPQLEVNADDVKAAHGATVGQLGEEERFYLESRGISAARAHDMLCQGFAEDALLKIEDESLRAYLSTLLAQGEKS
jgi:Fe-S cluster assembly protein SufD